MVHTFCQMIVIDELYQIEANSNDDDEPQERHEGEP
jgi:hypothetical protein